MSSKIRLEDLSAEAFDDMDNSFFGEDKQQRPKKAKTKRKRQMIEDYMEERQLKRRISDGFEWA
ncbi:PA3496 family putative envelope integrity protein [Aliamphritea hakodatensis]|uniref:PA3496 family putative envelope integrity protein n=1 Tax=Aliamphritea hakodatensis TaxID=2895352 RepID=UPI0022FD7419|nr:hypothetical protein [Aliamphritea hakodatensis]